MNRKILLIPILILMGLAASCSDASGKGDLGSQSPAEARPEEGPQKPDAEPAQETPYKGGFTREQRQADAEAIIGIMHRNYAPRPWKEELLGVSFEEVSKKFFDRAGEEMSDAEFYAEIAKYLAGFKDSHVGFEFPSSAKASLPFSMVEFGGIFYVEEVDHPKEGVRLDMGPGDEVVSVCGVKPADIREELKGLIGDGNEETTDAMATYAITARRQWNGFSIPTGACLVVVLSKEDGERREIGMEWKVEGFEFAQLNDPGPNLGKGSSIGRASGKSLNLLERLRTKEADPRIFGPRASMGNPASFLPQGPSFVERKKGPYRSGVMEVDGRQVGFLRIHRYSAHGFGLQDALAELEEEIEFFEENTDALIIDQTSNPGGDWCYTLEIASFFFDEPFVETPDMVRANRSWVVEFEDMATYGEMPEEDKAVALEIAAGMREALKKGSVLSDPVAVCNMGGKVAPYVTKGGRKIHYSKPVMILVNEKSISCGDSFPALMQDAGRAVIFGARTAGAGGSVGGSEGIGFSEISMSYTISLGVRERDVLLSDGRSTRFIENAGVVPDVPYEVTANDFFGGYVGYLAAMEGALLEMMK